MSKLNHLLGLVKRYEMTGEPDLEIEMAKLKGEIEDSLKLEELVKEELLALQHEDLGGDWVMVRQGLLEKLVEQSQNTNKEEGKADE